MIATVPMFLLTLVLSAAGTAVAAEAVATPPPGPNVTITLVVGRTGGGAKDTPKAYKMVGQAGEPTRMLMGFRMPIPTRSSGEGETTTSYVYQNVGVTADVEPTLLPDGRFLVEGRIEISGAREWKGPDGAASDMGPLIGTFQQELHVLVSRGKKVRISEAPDPEAGTLYVDLEVNLAE